MKNEIAGLEKLANGFDSLETIDDYALDPDSGELKLIKRRVTTKYIPPDLDAYKLLYGTTNFDALSDEELQEEKERLIRSLIESAKKQTNKE